MNNNMAKCTLSKGYQISLPAVVRKELGVVAGDTVEFVRCEGGVVIKRMMSREEQVREMLAEFDRINAEYMSGSTAEQRKFDEVAKGWTAAEYREYKDNLAVTKEYNKEKYGV